MFQSSINQQISNQDRSEALAAPLDWKRICILLLLVGTVRSRNSGAPRNPPHGSRHDDVSRIRRIVDQGGWKEARFNVLDFGAIGDGIHDDSAAIQRAIVEVSRYQRRRTLHNDNSMSASSFTYPSLYFPPLLTFITAPFNLTSHMVLRVDGTLRAISNSTKNWEDVWPKISPLPSYGSADDAGFFLQYQALVFVKDATDLKIVGKGTIDGVGEWWWDSFRRLPESTALHAGRPNLIQLQNCSDIELHDIELRNSPFWTLHPVYCRNMVIRNIRIRAPMYAPNVDGIDLDSCQNVLVEGCDISCGDDHIAIKSGVCGNGDSWGSPSGASKNERSLLPNGSKKDPISCSQDSKFRNGDYVSRNLTIASNTLGTGMGIALGSELSGGIQDVVIRDNRIGYGCWHGHDDPARSCGWSHALHVKTTLTRGGFLRNIHFFNNIAYNTTGIFYLETDYQDKDRQVPPNDYNVTDIRGMVLQGTTGLGAAKAITFACSPYMTCKEVTVVDTYIQGAPDNRGNEDNYHCEFVESYVSKRNHPRGFRKCFRESMNRTSTVLATSTRLHFHNEEDPAVEPG